MALQPRTLANATPARLQDLSEQDLLKLRNEIDAVLNIGSLEHIDIGEEIALQLRTIKLLQVQSLNDSEASYAHKAQTSSVVVRLLADLTRMRTDLHNAERFMMVENALIEALKDQPIEVKDAFFTIYEKIVAKFDIGLKISVEEPQDGQ